MNVGALWERLEQDDAFDAAEALHELPLEHLKGELRRLLRRLARIDVENPGEGYLAALIVEVLKKVAAPGDAAAAKALFDVCRSAADCSDDAQLESGVIEAVRVLRPPWAAEWLTARLADEQPWCFFADELAQALADVAGVTAATTLMALLDAPAHEEIGFDGTIAAVRALGRLGHQPARPALEALRRHEDPEVANAAREALVVLVPTSARSAALDAAAALAPATPHHEWKRVANWVAEHRVVEAVPLLLSRLEAVRAAGSDVRWAEREVWQAALEVAPDLVRADLRRAVADEARDRVTRLSAWLLTVDPTDEAQVIDLIEFARQTLPANQAELNHLLEIAEDELMKVLLAAGRASTSARRSIARALDGLRRGPTALVEGSVLRRQANAVIRELTGTDRYSQFDAWLAANS